MRNNYNSNVIYIRIYLINEWGKYSWDYTNDNRMGSNTEDGVNIQGMRNVIQGWRLRCGMDA